MFLPRFFTHLFFLLWLGSLFSATAFALWQTQGKTVLSLNLLLLLLWVGNQVVKKNKKKSAIRLSRSATIANVAHIRLSRSATIANILAPIHWKWSQTLTNVLFLVFVIFLFWLANAAMVFRWGEDVNFAYWLPSKDLAAYSRYVEMLLLTGQENYHCLSANYFEAQFHGCSPYHFYEFWLAAFFSKLFGFQPLTSYWLVTYPLFYLTIWCGAMAVCEYAQVRNYRTTNLLSFKNLASFSFNATSVLNPCGVVPTLWARGLFCLTLLLVGGCYFPAYQVVPFLKGTEYLHNNTLLTFGLVEPFLIATFLLWKQRKYYIAFLALFAIPLISITTLVGVLGIGVAYMFWHIIDKGYCRRKVKIFLPFAITMFLLIIAIVIFYWILGIQQTAIFSFNEVLPVYAFRQFSWGQALWFLGKGIFIVFGLYLGKIALLYLPFVLLAVLLQMQRRGENIILTNFSMLYKFFKLGEYSLQPHRDWWQLNFSPFLTILFCITLLGTAAMWLLQLHPDSHQLLTNVLVPFLNLALAHFFLVGFLQKKFTRSLTFIFGLLVVYQFYFSILVKYSQIKEEELYSTTYLEKISQLPAPPTQRQQFGAFLYGKEFYPHNLYSKGSRYNVPATYLAVLPQFYTVINIEIFDIPTSPQPIHQLFESRSLANSEFYQFVAKQKRNQQFVSIGQSQVDCILHYQLGFLVLSKQAMIRPELQKFIQKNSKMTIADEKSGEQFVVLYE